MDERTGNEAVASFLELEQLPPEQRLRLCGLAPREVEATLLVARGHTVKRAANLMGVVPGTVMSLIQRAREKLACDDSRALRMLLLRAGVVQVSELVS